MANVTCCMARSPPFGLLSPKSYASLPLPETLPSVPSRPLWDHRVHMHSKKLPHVLLSALQAKQSKFSLCRHVSFSPNLSADPCRQQVWVCRGVACGQGAAGGQQNGSVWSALVHPDSMDAAESSMALAAVTSHCCLRLSGLDSQPHHPVLWTSESQCTLGIPSSLC